MRGGEQADGSAWDSEQAANEREDEDGPDIWQQAHHGKNETDTGGHQGCARIKSHRNSPITTSRTPMGVVSMALKTDSNVMRT